MPAWTERDWDHERDSRKHDFPTIARLEPKITTALEIAVLCQAISPMQAAELIEQYARTYASGSKLEAL
jgi:hypothetical protein